MFRNWFRKLVRRSAEQTKSKSNRICENGNKMEFVFLTGTTMLCTMSTSRRSCLRCVEKLSSDITRKSLDKSILFHYFYQHVLSYKPKKA